jgi:hypothetical protein
MPGWAVMEPSSSPKFRSCWSILLTFKKLTYYWGTGDTKAELKKRPQLGS